MPIFGWLEIGILVGAVALFALRLSPWLRAYHPLFGAGCALLLISAAFPRAGNPVGEFLFGNVGAGPRLPREIFGIAWWILGAWLFKGLLDLFLGHTFFPDNDEPHARRLFADLASGLIYILAIVGIVGTVFNQPVSTFFATSGVVAIVLGLALQNILGDVLAGLAINIERPFGAGDWISLPDQVTGQVMQVNWRATRLRTWSHDLVIIPNAVISRAMVTNHSRPRAPHRCILRLKVDLVTAPALVLSALRDAAADCPGLAHGTIPIAYALSVSGCKADYELAFALENFAQTPMVRSEMITRVADAFTKLGIAIGASPLDIRMLSPLATIGAMSTPPDRAILGAVEADRHESAS
jgi:small-conductance mechanosensitive channel